jgi:ABC-type multidrug transport system fused ATPase/permease subunit
MAKKINNVVNDETDSGDNTQQILTRKLERALKLRRAFSAIDQNINGILAYDSDEKDKKKSRFQLDVERLQNEIEAKDKASKEAIANPKNAMNVKPDYKKPKKVADGDKKIYIVSGILLILGPYAMGMAVAWAAPLGIALIAFPFAVSLVAKTVNVFAKAKAVKLIKELNKTQEEVKSSRKEFVENNTTEKKETTKTVTSEATKTVTPEATKTVTPEATKAEEVKAETKKEEVKVDTKKEEPIKEETKTEESVKEASKTRSKKTKKVEKVDEEEVKVEPTKTEEAPIELVPTK